MLKFQFFGTGHASFNGEPLPGFPRHQAYQILCYLLLTPRRPQLRETLSSILWSEYSSPVARKYLRNALWRLRQFFEAVGAIPEDYLLVEEDSVAFISSSPYWLDVEVFENTITRYQGLPLEALSPSDILDLEKAIQLYSGDLLEGIFDEWCLYERERFSLLYLKGLSYLMNYYEYSSKPRQAIVFGQKILDRDNTRESVHLQMMRLQYQLGDRDAALLQYKRCAQTLKNELGLEPMKETTLAFQQMSHNQYNGKLAQPSAGNSAGAPRQPAVDPGSPSIVEYALKKIQRLQAVLDDTTAEIHQLETLLNQARVDSKNS